VTLLPVTANAPLREQLQTVRAIHRQDLANGLGRVWLPQALDRKYSNAAREWGWQYVFPAADVSADPRSGIVRRHHVHESLLQRAIKAAATLWDAASVQLTDQPAFRLSANISGMTCLGRDSFVHFAPYSLAGSVRFHRPI
jgi:hypothetical protein